VFIFHPKEKFLLIPLFLLIAAMAIFWSLQKPNEATQESSKQTASPSAQKSEKKILKVGQKTIEVEVAQTQEELQQGLSGRAGLEQNTGMYFVFNEKREATFWMFGMRFSIDIIWIDGGEIVGVEKNAPIPNSGDIPTFTSPQPITNVLEVPAGFFDQNNLQIGDSVTLL
jgi:uncharacterized membrane protein (UPF0127 family)